MMEILNIFPNFKVFRFVSPVVLSFVMLPRAFLQLALKSIQSTSMERAQKEDGAEEGNTLGGGVHRAKKAAVIYLSRR